MTDNDTNKLLENLAQNIQSLSTKIDEDFKEIKKDVNDLKIGMARVEERIDGLSREFKSEITRVEERLESSTKEVKLEIARVEEKLESSTKEVKLEIARVEEKLEGSIKEVNAEIKGIDTRISNQEFITRSAFAALLIGVGLGIIKLLFPNYF